MPPILYIKIWILGLNKVVESKILMYNIKNATSGKKIANNKIS